MIATSDCYYDKPSDKDSVGCVNTRRRNGRRAPYHYNGSGIKEQGISWTSTKIVDELAFRLMATTSSAMIGVLICILYRG
jgi:hypothetical protein